MSVCVCVEHLNRCQTSTWWCRFWLFVLFSFFSLRDALSTSTAVFNFNIHFRAGGRSVMESLLPTKTLTTDGDTRLGQSGVPALVWSPVVQGLLPFNFHFLTMRRVSTQEPPWRFVQFSALLSQSVNLFHLALILAIVSSRSFLGSFHRPIPVRYNWSVFARKMHSTSEFAKIVLSKCVCVCTIWTDVKLLRWLRFTFQYFYFPVCRGAQKAHRAVPNEALYGVSLGYPGWSPGRTCNSIFSMSNVARG